jgi:hypothetical protein
MKGVFDPVDLVIEAVDSAAGSSKTMTASALEVARARTAGTKTLIAMLTLSARTAAYNELSAPSLERVEAGSIGCRSMTSIACCTQGRCGSGNDNRPGNHERSRGSVEQGRAYSCRRFREEYRKCAFNLQCDRRLVERLRNECLQDGGGSLMPPVKELSKSLDTLRNAARYVMLSAM